MDFAMARLFISQQRLDSWTEEEKVKLEGDTLFLNEMGRSFSIKTGVRFMNVSGSDADPHDLLGKVKDEEELVEMGAEHYMTSVILGDTAYDVQVGFVGKALPK